MNEVLNYWIKLQLMFLVIRYNSFDDRSLVSSILTLCSLQFTCQKFYNAVYTEFFAVQFTWRKFSSATYAQFTCWRCYSVLYVQKVLQCSLCAESFAVFLKKVFQCSLLAKSFPVQFAFRIFCSAVYMQKVFQCSLHAESFPVQFTCRTFSSAV